MYVHVLKSVSNVGNKIAFCTEMYYTLTYCTRIYSKIRINVYIYMYSYICDIFNKYTQIVFSPFDVYYTHTRSSTYQNYLLN